MADSPLAVRRELPVYSWTDWDSVSLVKAAIRELENGIFFSAAQVVDQMTRDDRIDGVLLARCGALPALPFQMDTGEDEGSSSRKAIAKRLEKKFSVMVPNPVHEDLVKWGILLGVGVAQKVWTPSADGSLDFTLQVWHPRHLQWRWDTESYWLNTVEGQVEIRENDPRFLLYQPYGNRRGWMRAKVRSLYIPWLIRQWVMRDWARNSEIHGVPVRKAKVPQGASDKHKERFFREVAALGAESTVILPTDAAGNSFDLELLEPTMDSSQSFERLLNAMSTSIAVSLLGQNLTTEVKGGSYSAAQVHQNVRNDVLRADGESFSECLKAQALRQWALYNLGNAELAPSPCWKTDPPENKAEKGTALKNLGEGISALQATGAQPDVDKLLEDHSVPTKGKAEAPPEATEGAEGEAEQGKEERPQLHRMARRKGRPSMAGAIGGQLYADSLTDTSTNLGAQALKDDLARIVDVITTAQSFDEVKDGLLKAYGKMSPERLAQLLDKALVLAEMAGKHAVLEDV